MVPAPGRPATEVAGLFFAEGRLRGLLEAVQTP
jgi:hypothetical protein